MFKHMPGDSSRTRDLPGDSSKFKHMPGDSSRNKELPGDSRSSNICLEISAGSEDYLEI
jgi:hypothetical protein